LVLIRLIQGKRFRKGFTIFGLAAILLALLLTAFLNQQAPTLAGANPAPYQVNYQVLDKWDNGYNIEVKITNTGTTAVKNWTISWQLAQNEQRLSDIWDANCSLANSRITCTNISWNGTIKAGSAVKFGLDLYGNGKVTQPTGFTVNNVTISTQNSSTATATATAKAAATSTSTAQPTTAKPATATATATTATAKPATATATATASATTKPATATATATAKPVTATPTATKAPTVAPAATPTATPIPPTATVQASPAGGWWKPTPDKPIAWHWQLSQEFSYPRDVIPGVTVYDIDGELTSADTVAKLHALDPNIKVICYIDAGVYETYRSDANRFPQSVIGNADTGWDGSYWLDVRQTDVLLPIMKDRMQKWCKDKGFDAVEPDETEVWSNNPGFPITKDQNNFYNQKIAELAHSLGLSVGLKGNTSEAPELWSYFDWTLNEQCWQYQECDSLKQSFLDHGKAVFNIEYDTNPDCTTANSWHMNSARRDLNLVGPTSSSYRFSPCVPYSKTTW
jgi:hypothetical protein